MRRRRRAAAPSPSLSAEAYRGRGGALEIWRYIGDMARGALCECHMPIESILCWGGGGWCASEIGDAPQASTGLSTGVMRGGALVESDHEPRAAGQPLGILLRAGAAYGKPQWHSPQRESSLQRAAPNSKLPPMRNARGGRDRAREAERDSVLIDAAARERVSTAPHTKGPTVMWHPLFEKNARSRFDMCEMCVKGNSPTIVPGTRKDLWAQHRVVASLPWLVSQSQQQAGPRQLAERCCGRCA